MLSETDIVYMERSLGIGSMKPRFVEEAANEYRRIADPGVSERDFVFGYVANEIRKEAWQKSLNGGLSAEQALYMGFIDGP